MPNATSARTGRSPCGTGFRFGPRERAPHIAVDVFDSFCECTFTVRSLRVDIRNVLCFTMYFEVCHACCFYLLHRRDI